VLVFHSSCEGTVRQTLGRGGSMPGAASAVPERVSGMQQWWLPFAAPSAGNHIAMYAQRHFHEYGTTREQMAQISLVERANAGKYEKGIYRDPLTMEDYLSARMITEPFCLFDCDIPIDFSAAVIVSRADATGGLRKPPVHIDATSTAMRSRMSWDQFDDLTTMVLRDAGADLWQHTDLRPADVDLAEIYDGFSFIAMAWLEALGFCGKGESGPFIEGGTRIALDGELPINTNGGQLSSGRMHGWGYLPEACKQLWGEGGERQVPNDPEVAVVASGGGTFAGALLLTRG
jgi:acetyl-CoA acetyltransferase